MFSYHESIIHRTLPGRIHLPGSFCLRHLGEAAMGFLVDRSPELSVEILPLDWPSGSTGNGRLNR